MKNLQLLTAAAAAAFVLGSSGSGVAATSPAPIRIDSCDYKTLADQLGMGNLFLNGHKNQFFNITFTNTGTAPVTDVNFQVDFEKSRYILDDVGTFAPGSQTTHHLRDHGKGVQALVRPSDEDPKSIVCTVLSAKYADGTTWTP